MSLLRRSFPMFVTVVAAAAVLTSACGQATIETDGSGNGAETTNDESSADGLQVVLTGPISGDIICPGNTRPCITLEGDLSADGEPPAADESYRVTGTLANGSLAVERVEQVPGPLDWLVDRCENKKTEAEFLAVASIDPEELMEQLGTDDEEDIGDGSDQLALYQHTIPDVYAVRWISPRQVIHLGVVGAAEPHQEALDDLGIGEYVCVVGEFKRSDIELEQLQSEIRGLVEGWPTVESWGAHRDHELGAVSIGLHRADAAMLADADERYGDSVILDASILVLNGSLADYEEALESNAAAGSEGGTQSDVATPDTAGLTASCGAVIFGSLPPDASDFEPIDDDIRAMLDELETGPLSVESAGFVPAYEWRAASRSDDKIVLFGERIEGEQGDGGDFADIRLENRDGIWSPSGWGGCNIEIDAPGFGSASTILDPDHEPDPESAELHVLIMERNCASGQAPVDREVLPVVIESQTGVEIITLVEPVAGGADCQGNPWHPITVTLQQPLGDRAVYDGHLPPPVELKWPPDTELLGDG